jgi:hypothetical protein
LMAVFSLLFGFWPWLLCWLKGEDLRALKAVEFDPTGRRLSRMGRRLAIVGILGFAVVLGIAVLWLSKTSVISRLPIRT